MPDTYQCERFIAKYHSESDNRTDIDKLNDHLCESWKYGEIQSVQIIASDWEHGYSVFLICGWKPNETAN